MSKKRRKPAIRGDLTKSDFGFPIVDLYGLTLTTSHHSSPTLHPNGSNGFVKPTLIRRAHKTPPIIDPASSTMIDSRRALQLRLQPLLRSHILIQAVALLSLLGYIRPSVPNDPSPKLDSLVSASISFLSTLYTIVDNPDSQCQAALLSFRCDRCCISGLSTKSALLARAAQGLSI